MSHCLTLIKMLSSKNFIIDSPPKRVLLSSKNGKIVQNQRCVWVVACDFIPQNLTKIPIPSSVDIPWLQKHENDFFSSNFWALWSFWNWVQWQKLESPFWDGGSWRKHAFFSLLLLLLLLCWVHSCTLI